MTKIEMLRRIGSALHDSVPTVLRLALLAPTFTLAALAASPTAAQSVVVGFDAAPTADFELAPHDEGLTRTRVLSGHYEIVADAVGPAGDLALNLDEQNLGLSKIQIVAVGDFDAVKLEVVNPADSVGEFMITAIGGSGATIPAPTEAGTFVLGPDFQGIQALEITQTQPGAFAIDDVELLIVPEPGFAAACAALAGGLAALGRRRSRR